MKGVGVERGGSVSKGRFFVPKSELVRYYRNKIPY